MNAHPNVFEVGARPAPHRDAPPVTNPASRTPWLAGLEADWRDMVLVHYRFDPSILGKHVALPLHLFDGAAYVSLLYFRLENLRPNGSGVFGRTALRLVSDHPFLNVRTYVRGPAGDGIFFLREWITNPLSCWLGPKTYGLPYRRAEFYVGPEPGGTESISLRRPNDFPELTIRFPSTPHPFHRAVRDSRDAFLVERYVAYANERGTLRSFHVEHAPWNIAELDWVRVKHDLVVNDFPWFAEGTCVGGHRSRGFESVFMSRPTTHCAEPLGREIPDDARH